MAIRGQKPKPTALKLVEGNPGKRPLPEGEPMPGGVPQMPRFVERRKSAARLWNQYAPILHWLTSADSSTFAQWCVLQAEFEKDPAAMTASRISQIRALAGELGMTPSARTRLGTNSGQKQSDPTKRFLTKRVG